MSCDFVTVVEKWTFETYNMITLGIKFFPFSRNGFFIAIRCLCVKYQPQLNVKCVLRSFLSLCLSLVIHDGFIDSPVYMVVFEGLTKQVKLL